MDERLCGMCWNGLVTAYPPEGGLLETGQGSPVLSRLDTDCPLSQLGQLNQRFAFLGESAAHSLRKSLHPCWLMIHSPSH